MMTLEPYVGQLKDSVKGAAALGGEPAEQLAERLMTAVEPAVRLALQGAISEALAQVSAELPGTTLQAALAGEGLEFTVDQAVVPDDATMAPEDAAAFHDAEPTARLNLRLPEELKARIEQAAAREGLSANAWLVRAAAQAVRLAETAGQFMARRGFAAAHRYEGWVS
jgi:predicted DNA binding CopG/RHH family protein